MSPLRPPFPWFGGKRKITATVWARFGRVRHYIEPFCGSAAVLLAAPRPAPLEVAGDLNGFVANFWRATKHQPAEVAREADYPVSHIDLHARHTWLLAQRDRVGSALIDPLWPGDARVAGWWLWDQCSWIGSGWCDWDGPDRAGIGQIPHIGDAGRGIQARGQIPHVGDAGMLTSAGCAAWELLHALAARLERVRLVHGDWHRCLNTHYGQNLDGVTAVFLDPPYRAFGAMYGDLGGTACDAAAAWARQHADLRVAICGHAGDYDLPGWDCERWQRTRPTYGGSQKTRDMEAIWFSPACLPRRNEHQQHLFDEAKP